jgi:deazaflavin-dependent oxidoreductase (nitroreductase family)
VPTLNARDRFFWVLTRSVNPLAERLARSGRGPFSLVRHVGRTSGRSYETPLILAPVRQGFIAELTYGEDVDWYRNVVAAGHCVVVYRGTEYPVVAVEPCVATVGRAAYPAPQRWLLKLARRDQFRLLRTSEPPAGRAVLP